MLGPEEIRNRFGYHKPSDENETVIVHRDLRVEFQRFAQYLDMMLPDGRAKAVALTELENTSMWSHKAVAELNPVVEG